MNIVQFIADHKVILWILLCLQVAAILQATLFYWPVVRFFERMLDSEFIQSMCQRDRLSAWYVGWWRDSLRSRTYRIAGGLVALAIAALAVAGIVLL